MLLNIITGDIGSGKSTALYTLIGENLKNNPTSNAILLVPEQFSHTADKTLNEITGGQGPNKIEVLTFSRLISRYIEQSGSLMPPGKIMLIKKACQHLSESNTLQGASGRAGFVLACADIFSEFKRYLITPDDLANLSTESTASSAKIRSLGEIYAGYLELFSEEFTDSEDAFSLMADYIRSTGVFSDTFFFIDDYSDFLPQHYLLLSALIECSKGVHISLCVGEDEELFAPSIKTKSRLIATAKNLGVQVSTKHLAGDAHYIKSPELRFLMKNWNSFQTYPGEVCDIELFSARDPYSEVEHIAGKIISLVRGGLRFRDIGVICGDTARYLHLAGAIFADYNIPYFADEKIPVSMHPISQTILSIFSILEDNWSYKSVFAYLRGGYIYDENATPINQEEIDVLENYIIKYGIKGKKAWFEDFTKGGETVFDSVIDTHNQEVIDLDAINRLRQRIIAPFANFLESKSRSAKKIAQSLFEFLQDINLYQGILAECDRFNQMGKRDEAEQFKKVWNSALEVLDQLVLTMGDTSLSREAFADYLRCGLSAQSISIIPSGLDRVSFGSVQKNSPTRVKALFIIGANKGLIPAQPSGSGIITDADRIFINNALSEKGKEIAPDDTQRIFLEDLKLYRTISAATEKLYISSPAFDESGNELTPSEFITELKTNFPELSAGDNLGTNADSQEILSSQKRGFYYMLSKLGEYYKDSPDRLWEEVRDWYAKRSEYRQRMEFLEAAAEYKKLKPRLSLEKARMLYGKNKRYSITALEKYSQCPFAYYMSKGLYAKPQTTAEVQKSHLGSLIHYAVCEYCKAVENGAKSIEEIRKNWQELTLENSTAVIENIMEKVRKKVLNGAEDANPRLSYLLSRCEKTLKTSTENIRKSIRSGDYVPIACEKDFETTINWKDDSVTLFGTIDRIDIAQDDKKAKLRVVDYKSGYKKFSIQDIANKLDMQLVLYAQSALDMHASGELEPSDQTLDPQITGIFYSRISEDFASIDQNDSSIAREENKKNQKLDGRIVIDGDSDNPVYDAIYEMDRGFETTNSSDYLRIYPQAKGGLKKDSQVIFRKDFDTITSFLKKTAVGTHKAIESGDISVSPYIKGTDSACQFCDYKQICMFDQDKDMPRAGYTGNDKPIEIMERAVTEDE